MNANPHTCRHLHIRDDLATAILYCPDCGEWWDADFETPTSDTRVSFDYGDENDTYENHPEWQEDDAPLNPDNEPTSEHMQYERTNKCTYQS